MNIRFRGRFTTSVKCLLSPSRGIRTGISSCMGCSWPVGSLSNIFWVIPSLWSVLLLWGILFKTEKLQDESPSGPLNLGLMV